MCYKSLVKIQIDIMSDKDIFYLDKILPDPEKVFGFEYKALDELSRDCVFVFDTNVLFVPFDTSDKNLDEIKNIFLKLKTDKRIFLPARVVREFANNRAKRLGNLFLKIRQTKDNLNSGHFKTEEYPLLQNNSSYQELLKNYNNITELIKASRKLLEQVESDILSWNWNDNVSKAYKEIFTPETIKEVQKSEEDLVEDLKFRIKHNIAPGYKDSGKLDDGIGDLIVWQTSLEIAKDNDSNLILVSNDQKNDWFYKQDKKGLYPKYELFDEFRRFTNGKSMQIINFPKFLELMHATPETVDEIKESIRKSKNEEYPKNYTSSDLMEGLMINHRKFGTGTIRKIYTTTKGNGWFEVDFNEYGKKKLLIGLTPFKIVNNAHNFLLRNPDFDGDPKTYQLLDEDDE